MAATYRTGGVKPAPSSDDRPVVGSIGFTAMQIKKALKAKKAKKATAPSKANLGSVAGQKKAFGGAMKKPGATSNRAAMERSIGRQRSSRGLG